MGVILYTMTEEKRESTSLKILPSIWKEAKIDAIRMDLQLSEYVERALLRYMRTNKDEKSK